VPSVTFGAVALGTSLGDPQSVVDTVGCFVPDTERVLRWGYHTYHRAPKGTGATDLAARAARTALARAGLDVKSIDELVVANSDVPEYLQWDVASAVGRRLGTGLAHCTLLTQGCAAGATAFQYIAGAFATRDGLDTILLVAVNQVSDAHTNRMRFNTCLTSDGAAAAVLQRDHSQLRWLATEQMTDPTCVDFFRLEYGGAAAPVSSDGRTNRDIDPLELVYDHFRREPDHLAEFKYALTSRVAAVVHRACARAGVAPRSLAKLVYINDNQQSIAEVARTVGIPIERTNAELAAAIGHCGAADHLLCVERYLERGELDPGDVVALAGVSTGMHWFCTLLEV
jgi:3-oxoacyl-[acyl-carrier-protein] synthase III